MQRRYLDEFPDDRDTTVRVITDDERGSLEAFPTEEVVSQSTYDTRHTIAIPTSNATDARATGTDDAIGNWTYAPPSRAQRARAYAAASRLRSFASAALVVAFGLGLFAGQAIIKRLVASPQFPREVPAPVESSKASAVIPAERVEAERTDEPVGPARSDARVANTTTGTRPPARPARVEPKPRVPASAPTARRPLPRRAAVAEAPPIATPVGAPPAPARPATPAAVIATANAAPSAAGASATVTAPPAAVASPAAAAPPAPGPNAATTPVPAAVVAQASERAVLGTLHRYQEAFSTLNSNEAHQVWPGVDERALERAFAQLERQTLVMKSCDVGVAGERAEATCLGTASYTRKVGNKDMRVEPRRWQFTLRNDRGEWLIERVDVR